MISLFRIDDRLIHAQVVIGWGRVLKPDRLVIADNAVSSDQWEKDLYLTAVPPEMKVSILGLRESVDQIKGGVFDSERIILLVKGPSEVLAMLDAGLEVEEVNVGGMHFSEGKEKIMENVYVDDADRHALRDLVKRGLTLEARALPESEKVIINSKVV